MLFREITNKNQILGPEYTQIKKSVKVTEKTVIITENLLILGQQIVLLILAKHDCNFLVSESSRFISKYTKN